MTPKFPAAALAPLLLAFTAAGCGSSGATQAPAGGAPAFGTSPAPAQNGAGPAFGIGNAPNPSADMQAAIGEDMAEAGKHLSAAQKAQAEKLAGERLAKK